MALRDIIETHFVGEGGRKLTPQQMERERRLAQAMISAGVDTSPVGHWTQGMARIANALAGNIKQARADKAERAGIEGAARKLADLKLPGLVGGSTAPAPSGLPPMGSLAAPSYRDAIASIESKGSGDYSAIGPTNPKLGRALGKYQIMEANIVPWSKEALGRSVTPKEFLANPAIQDALFDHKFGSYVSKFGQEGAAQAWFAGPGGVGKTDRKDALGTDVGTYGRKFMSALGNTPQAAIEGIAPTGSAATPSLPGMVPQSDASNYFPLAPSPDSPPAMGSYAAPAQQQGGDFQKLIEAASDPWMNDGQRAVINMGLQQMMQQNDPMRQLQMQKAQLEIDALRSKPQTEYGFTALPDGTVLRTDKRSGNAQPIYSAGQKPTSLMQNLQSAGIEPGTPEYRDAILNGTKGGVNVNIGDGEGKKFYEKLDEKNANMFGTLLEDGTNARSTIMRIDRLDQLLKTVPTGAVANFKQIAANYGLRLGDDVDNIQAAQALINQIVPQQRPAGSGPMSDADLELFKQSVPRIINSPGGNQIIIETMRGIAKYTAMQGDIAARVANREIKPEEGRALLANLPNPLAAKTPTRIGSPAEFNALPSGAEFIAPDGSLRRKP